MGWGWVGVGDRVCTSHQHTSLTVTTRQHWRGVGVGTKLASRWLLSRIWIGARHDDNHAGKILL